MYYYLYAENNQLCKGTKNTTVIKKVKTSGLQKARDHEEDEENERRII